MLWYSVVNCEEVHLYWSIVSSVVLQWFYYVELVIRENRQLVVVVNGPLDKFLQVWYIE